MIGRKFGDNFLRNSIKYAAFFIFSVFFLPLFDFSSNSILDPVYLAMLVLSPTIAKLITTTQPYYQIWEFSNFVFLSEFVLALVFSLINSFIIFITIYKTPDDIIINEDTSDALAFPNIDDKSDEAS